MPVSSNRQDTPAQSGEIKVQLLSWDALNEGLEIVRTKTRRRNTPTLDTNGLARRRIRLSGTSEV